MNAPKIKNCVEVLQKDLGESLLSTDIWGSDGLSFATHNPKPATTALFEELTKNLKGYLERSDLSSLGNYYLVSLDNDQTFVVLSTEELRWGILIDDNKLSLGLLFGIAIPNALRNLQAAIRG